MKLFLSLQMILFIITGAIVHASQESEPSEFIPFSLLLNPHHQDSIIIYRVLTGIYQDPLVYKGENKQRNYSEDNLLEFVKNGIHTIQKNIEQENRRVFIFANCCKNEKQKPNGRKVMVYEKQQNSKSCRKPTMRTRIESHHKITDLINDRSLIIYNMHSNNKNSCLQDYIDHIYQELAHYKAPLLLLIDDYLFKIHENIIERIAVVQNRFRAKKIISYDVCTKSIDLYSLQNRDLCTQSAYIFVSGMLVLQVLKYCNII